MSMYGNKLYASIEKETGQNISYKKCGSVSLARTQDRMEALKLTKQLGISMGLV